MEVRRGNVMVNRKYRQEKPLIVVFCEGESEKAYMDFLKRRFSKTAIIRYYKGLFEEAKDDFEKNAKFREDAEIINEIWFFFDVEVKDIGKADQRLKIARALARKRKKPNIKVRLLMTSGCVEYWFLLHYAFQIPAAQTVADKENIYRMLLKYIPEYEKGNLSATNRIGEYYKTASANGKRTMKALGQYGLNDLEDSEKRNAWLLKNCKTFSNVYEAIDFLESCSG